MSADRDRDSVSLAGTLESVRFESDDGQFAVVGVRTRKGLVTVVGNLVGAMPGERLQLRGRWEQNPKFGRQFRTTEAVVLPPTTTDGIIKYLSSGLIEGIGPVLAERLVQAFGEDTLDVLETERDRLLDVPGIGKVRQQRILKAWDQQRAVRQVMLFLSSNGVSTTYAHRIFQTYGDDAVRIVQQEPYRLARDIFGIGFLSADRIAQRMGIAAEARERVAAGLEWTLDEAGGQGHAYLPREALVETAAAILSVDPTIVETVLEQATVEGILISSDDLDIDDAAVYTRHSYNAEDLLAERVRQMASQHLNDPLRHRLLQSARRAEGRLGITLEASQRRAVETLLDRRLGVLTGGPGTGKTTIVRIFADAVEGLGRRVLLGAPTGRAARRLGEASGRPAETLHRLLQFSFAERRFMRDEDHPLDANLIVVDEASMIDQYLARSLFRAVGPECAVLLVGDADQLPSVGPGNVLKDLLGCRQVTSASLTEVFRQAAQSGIVRNAHRIRQGLAPELPKDPSSENLTDFYHIAVDAPDVVLERIVQLVTERIPNAFDLDPIEDIQVLAPMHRGDCGIDALNRALQQALNPRGRAVSAGDKAFRVGDKVIQLRNDYQREVFNGQIGRLQSVDAETGSIFVTFDDRRVEYGRTDLHELALAYCISIHKSQGSEYRAVVVPLVTQHYIMLQRNLLYTAITRARDLVCLVGQQRALELAIKNADPQRRYTGLASRILR